MNLYPIKFKPILKEKVWGGNQLNCKLNKASTSNMVGESWEISDVESEFSIILNGDYQGYTLKDLITKFPLDLIGNNHGFEFPILIKFLDVQVPLSIQVHPNEEFAQKIEGKHGKTEMWYIVSADEGAEIYLGWKKEYSKEELIQAYKRGNIKDYLKVYKPQKGDFYFVESGSIHALGGGLIVAEIQQTSDITYRIYDWGRTDRELHIDKAIQVTNYQFKDDFRLNYNKTPNKLNKVIESDYFSTYFLHVNKEIKLSTEGSFDILICIEGEGEILYNGKKEKIKLGDTFLVPAKLEKYSVVSNDISLLKVKK